MKPQREGRGSVHQDVAAGKLTQSWKTSKEYSPLSLLSLKIILFREKTWKTSDEASTGGGRGRVHPDVPTGKLTKGWKTSKNYSPLSVLSPKRICFREKNWKTSVEASTRGSGCVLPDVPTVR